MSEADQVSADGGKMEHSCCVLRVKLFSRPTDGHQVGWLAQCGQIFQFPREAGNPGVCVCVCVCLATPYDTWDFSSLTRDQTWAPCSGSLES